MAKLNMAKINTLIREGYFLAGVMMAANMFVVNEMKATEKEEKNSSNSFKLLYSSNSINIQYPEIKNYQPPQGGSTNNNIPTMVPSYYQGSYAQLKQTVNNFPYQGEGGKFSSDENLMKTYEKNKEKKDKKGYLGFLLYWENTINLIGGALFTLANSFYKFYEDKTGFYFDYYFAGWNSNPFAKGYLQFCPNINLGRGICWSIPHIIYSIMIKGSKKGKKDGDFSWVKFFIKDILRGFVSMPLTVHFSNFSISISLDSIIWGIVGMILESKDKKNEKKEDKEGEELIDFDLNSKKNEKKENKEEEELINKEMQKIIENYEKNKTQNNGPENMQGNK